MELCPLVRGQRLYGGAFLWRRRVQIWRWIWIRRLRVSGSTRVHASADQDFKIQEPIFQIKTKQSIEGKIIALQRRTSAK